MGWTAGGRWVPSPGVSSAPPLPRVAGVWGPITLEGDSIIDLDGFSYPVPLLADLKIVSTGRSSVVHVRHQGRVFIFHGGEQLQESDDEAKKRAADGPWKNLPGSKR